MTEAIRPLAHDLSQPETDWSGEAEVSTSHRLRSSSLRSKDRRITVVLMLLDGSPEHQWRLDDLARKVNLSPGRLAHLFKSETRVSIQQYLTKLRLAKAQRELETTFLSIKEIAASSGFPNVNRFSSSFKAATGVTPCAYRNRLTSAHANRKNLVLARSAKG